MDEKIQSVITALQDIKKALESDAPVDCFITEWEKARFVRPEVKDVYAFVRAVYAEQLEEAINLLSNPTKTF